MGANVYRELRPQAEAEEAYERMRAEFEASGADGPDGAFGRRFDFDRLREEYPGIAAWVYSPGTVIDYPVMQGEDNLYYLERLPDGTANRNGSVYIDYRNRADFSGRLTVLYGHHIRGGRMFSALSEYKKQEYYESHPEIYIYTPGSCLRVRLWAGVILDADWENFPIEMTAEEAGEWLAEQTGRSTFESGWEPDPDGRFVAFCTCTYEYDNARYAVYGQIVEERKAGE